MSDFSKIVRLGTSKTCGGRGYSIFCHIIFKGGTLSITGVEGPLESGNALGACGQIDMHLRDNQESIKLAPEWTRENLARFFEVWDEWHLNGPQAGCEHQRKLGWGNEHLSQPCPECGYKYGTAWLRKEIPTDVLEFLRALPGTDRRPAWI